MAPKNLKFGGGAADTILHPIVAVTLVIAILLILMVERKKIIIPFLLAFFTIPVGQVVVLAGVHFTALRFLILAVIWRRSFARKATSGPKFACGFNALDRIVVIWALLTLVMFYFQYFETQVLVKGLGDMVDTLGAYLALRFLVSDREVVWRMIKVLAVICVIQGICMMSEQITHQNVFNALGANNPTIREGHVRSEGAMGTLYAGAFAGFSIPMFLALWYKPKARTAMYTGLIGATAMAFASHASTSWMAYGGSLLGLCFWPIRKQMRLIRWAIVLTLVILHLVMNGPVWSLIEHVDITGGSSSYHRYMLVDNCIRHFSDWWLIGYKNYPEWGFDMWDLCNQFVVAALGGGLITLIYFIRIYSNSFAAIGLTRRQVQGDRNEEWFLWCLGSSLLANAVASFGINYMVHLMTCFFCLLTTISVATFGSDHIPTDETQTSDWVQYATAPSPERLAFSE